MSSHNDRIMKSRSSRACCLLGLALLTLCSCRAHRPADVPPSIPSPATTGAMGAGAMPCGCSSCDVAGAYATATDCVTTAGWSANEWLCDGGDRASGVAVSPDWEVYGLDTEDTIAHYDTLDGRTLVEASNRVCIYAPRFGAVRSVTVPVASQQIDAPRGMLLPEGAGRIVEAELATTTLQQEQLQGHVEFTLPSSYKQKQVQGVASLALLPLGFHRRFAPYENLELIRTGVASSNEEAWLVEAMLAAIAWTSDLGTQVVLEGRPAVALTGDQRAQVVYTVEDLRNHPKLRVVKVASTGVALPGDTVDFTLRFDNVGDAPLGNIVLMDNLTARLEFVEGSAQSSREANFSTEKNEAESVVLRWEFTEALEPGEGGIVRFTCRVR